MINHTGKVFGAVIVAALVGLAVSGCSTTGQPAAQTGAYATAVALTAADNVAMQYVTLPICGPTHAKPLCSEASVSAQIKAAAQTAHDAVRAAEKSGDAGAAQAAVAALVSITPKPGA